MNNFVCILSLAERFPSARRICNHDENARRITSHKQTHNNIRSIQSIRQQSNKFSYHVSVFQTRTCNSLTYYLSANSIQLLWWAQGTITIIIMDDLDDLRASEFVTDTDDQDSLDERIDSEQNLRNQQLWASFQNAACCITKLYKDRGQPNVSLWIPFQNAASNLTTLYKDCIESQRRFAKIGYQIGRKKRKRSLKSIGKRSQHQSKHQQQLQHRNDSMPGTQTNCIFGPQPLQQPNGVSSILAVNQLNLNCDEPPAHSMQAQTTGSLIDQQQQHQQPFALENLQQLSNHHQDYHHTNQSATSIQHQLSAQATQIGNNEDNLVTFQQALVQPAVIRSIKSGQSNNVSHRSNYLNNRAVDSRIESEEDRLLELNRFLSEEYHRHVGSRKRSCSAIGGNIVKRVRE